MKNKKYLLFDLDGTVTDSAPGVIASATYAMEKQGVPVPDSKTMAKFLGPPLKYSFMTYAGIEEERVEETIKLYREHYKAKGIYQNSLYAGAAEFFEKAVQQGKVLLIASSKPLPFVKTVLEYLKVDKYFSHISAASFSDAHLSKAAIVARAMEMAGASAKDCVMIGDRCYDIEGAADNGIPCVGIVNGSIFRDELTETGAAAVAANFSELDKILL
ncbi:MAG: HAD-IA family hydrolase [Clostridia bacterium]|nr:HAD-IA family hydrolase [Clostridia bacterium]